MLGGHTRLLFHRSGTLHQEPLGLSGTRLVTPSSLFCSMLSATPGSRFARVILMQIILPAPTLTGSALTQIYPSRGYVSDSGHTPFTSQNSYGTFHAYYRAVDQTLPGRAFLFPLNNEPEPGSNQHLRLRPEQIFYTPFIS